MPICLAYGFVIDGFSLIVDDRAFSDCGPQPGSIHVPSMPRKRHERSANDTTAYLHASIFDLFIVLPRGQRDSSFLGRHLTFLGKKREEPDKLRQASVRQTGEFGS